MARSEKSKKDDDDAQVQQAEINSLVEALRLDGRHLAEIDILKTSSLEDIQSTTILSSELCSSVTQFILDCYRSNDCLVEQPLGEDISIRPDQIAKLGESIDLNNVAVSTLRLAAASLQLFVRDNFVPGSSNSYDQLSKPLLEVRDKARHRSLSRDGSEVEPQVANPWLLKLTQMYWNLMESFSCSTQSLEFLVWRHRYLTIHSIILLESSEYLSSELKRLQDFIFRDLTMLQSAEEKNQFEKFQIPDLCLELAQSSLLRGDITLARKLTDHVSEITGLSIEHTGALGRRTKFQQNDIPQLVIKVSQTDAGSSVFAPDDSHEDISDLPADVRLDDDTLLPDIQFVNADDESSNLRPATDQVLSTKAQLLMMTNLDMMIRSEVMEESLKDEWVLAYLRSILKSATIWSIKFKALAMRSQIEKKNMRKMDRALRQMEELIKSNAETGKNMASSLKYFYSVLPLSVWQTQKALGDMSFDLGLFKNALDVYQRIEYYEGMIKCYCALGQTGKAEKMIRQELEKNETPYLHCLLGDVTDSIEHYEKAWTLSKCRFARAKKSIGTYYYVRKQYDEAIENYEQALSANPSNISILSLLAYCCLITEKFERAAECYRNITYQDDSSFLAWNNLSKAYIKLNQKERAWRTLREAIKCNYEEWKIWENFMLVSIEIGALDDVITAWHRIIDIKSAHKDDQILEALTYCLLKRDDDRMDDEYMKLLGEALKLVARLNSTSDCSPRLWICYFKLLIKEFKLVQLKSQSNGEKLSQFDVDSRVSKIVNALQRATPISMKTDLNWPNVPEKVKSVMDSFDELEECYKIAGQVLGDRTELIRQQKYFSLSRANARKLVEDQTRVSSA